MALAKLQRGCLEDAMLFFFGFHKVSVVSMHLAFWLTICGAQCGSRSSTMIPATFQFQIFLFLNENANSEGRLLVAHAREAGSIISPFPITQHFLDE